MTGHPDRAPNEYGWYNAPLTVTWTSIDPAPSSGSPTVPAPTTVTTPGAAQTITSEPSCDPAGNCAAGQFTVSIDQTAPQISVHAAPDANTAGWHSTDTEVSFSCTDALSGIASCPPPVTVTTDTAGQPIYGTALDKAGNSATVSLIVKRDATAPTITATPYPAANSSGWNNTDVTVFFTCSDGLSGIATCSEPATVTTEGASQTATGQAVDYAGNSATAALAINIDKTPPTLATPAWSANPKPVSTPSTPVSTDLSVPANDTLSGVTGGEFFIGADPGAGNATPMTYAAGQLTAAAVGSDLPVGVHDVGIRARDAAGNWSAVATTMLVVYEPATALVFTGRNKKDLVPSLANGDRLPGLTDSGQTDTADYGFTVEYRNGTLDPRNDFHFTYTTGSRCNTPNPQSCHTFTVDATSFAWLIIDQANNSRGRYQGTATVTVDGVSTSNVFTVQGIDGDRLTPTGADAFLLKIYAAGANPDSASSLYQASGSLPGGNDIRIH